MNKMIKSKLAKKILAALTSLCLAATAAAPALMSVSAEAVTPEASVVLRADVGSAKPGDTINVDVVVDSDTGVGAMQVFMEYDVDQVTYVSGATASMDGMQFANEETPEDGTINFVGFNMANNVPCDNVSIATLVFTVNEGVTEGNVRFALADNSTLSYFINDTNDYLTTNLRDALVAATDNTTLPFDDVAGGTNPGAPSMYYDQSVQLVYNNGLMTGMNPTEFGAGETLSRAHFATILYRMAGTPSVEGMENPFTDNQDTSTFFHDAVIWCNEVGVITGYYNADGTFSGRFGPSDAISREQLAIMMYRFASNYIGSDSVGFGASLDSFADASSVSSYAVEALSWAVANGIISGRSTVPATIAPTDNASRGDCATMLARYMYVL